MNTLTLGLTVTLAVTLTASHVSCRFDVVFIGLIGANDPMDLHIQSTVLCDRLIVLRLATMGPSFAQTSTDHATIDRLGHENDGFCKFR